MRDGLCRASPDLLKDKHEDTFLRSEGVFLAANFCIYSKIIRLRWQSWGTGEQCVLFLNMDMFVCVVCENSLRMPVIYQFLHFEEAVLFCRVVLETGSHYVVQDGLGTHPVA